MPPDTLSPKILDCIRRALDEDIASGDATSNAIIPPDESVLGRIIAKQAGIVAGLQIAQASFQLLDEQVAFRALVDDGSVVKSGQTLANLSGSARSILTAERTALNFLMRMSGIATLTHNFVQAVAGT
ncbi:MAG: nicotinate-nucleotide diphosphorylase (carboxylating), partial [Anaerolineales bacterium]|nr:nicotinate-nucleotide diphosphorylase (carboxylating) [Anaerolineales bacterium]